MNRWTAAFHGELLKIARAGVGPASVGFFGFGGVMIATMMLLAAHPEWLSKAPLVAAKASALGSGNWISLLALLVQMGLVLSQLGFGFATAWLFGREAADRTLKDLLALPIARSTLVAAKFAAAALWCAVLGLTTWVCAVATGLAWHLEGFSWTTLAPEFGRYALAVGLSLPLATVAGFLASATRGYLLPLAVLFCMLILTNMLAVVAPAVLPWFPWGIPAVLTSAGGGGLPSGGAGSALLLLGTGAAGWLATVAWWRWADHT